MRSIEPSQSSTGVRGTVPPKCGVRHGVATVSRHATPTPDPGSAGVCHDRATAATVLSSTGGGFGRRFGASGCLLEGLEWGDPGADRSRGTPEESVRRRCQLAPDARRQHSAANESTQDVYIKKTEQMTTQQWVSGDQKWQTQTHRTRAVSALALSSPKRTDDGRCDSL